MLLVLFSAIPLEAGAATAMTLTAADKPKVIITEIQTTGNSASEEFVEFYNTTDADVDFADTVNAGKTPWKLQFFSATATANGTPDWSKPSATVSLTGVVPAHGYYILTSTGYAPGGIDGDQAYGSRLSDTGGGLQLVTASTTQTTYYDRLMWKQATDGQILPTGVIATPAAHGSLQRVPNDDSEYVNAEGILTGFVEADSASPKDMWQAPEPPAEVSPTPDQPDAGSTDPGTNDSGAATDQPTEPIDPALPSNPTNVGLVNPYLTELLPNPAAPQTDASDEFIELYNPNTTAFDLKNYTLEVGTTTLHDFTFTSDSLLEPGSYTAFYSAVTHLSLSNSGGQARLLGPGGAVLSQTPVYDAAGDGASWSLSGNSGDAWAWSTTPTPGAANVISVPVAPIKTTGSSTKVTAATKTPAAAKKTTSKTTSAKVKGTTKAKTKAKTTVKKKTAKTKATKTKLATTAQTTTAPDRAPIHSGILVTVVGLAVLYAAYEYRHDIQNRLTRLRRNRAVRAYARQ